VGNAGDKGQEFLRGGVKIHTHIVHTAFYRFIQLLLEQLLIDIMLVPTPIDFGSILTSSARVLQAATDADSTCNVKISVIATSLAE